MSKAKADGNQIFGIIRGTGENHGGKANTLTSPNPQAQKSLLLDTYRRSGIDPSRVGYIEAHGTGTPLGDPIETEGLKLAFEELYTDSMNVFVPGSCGVSSVKTNIGHLEAAAGIAGVLKMIMSLQEGIKPGNPNLTKANKLDGDGHKIHQQEIKNRGGSILVCENVIQEAVQIAKTLVTKPKESLKLLKQKISNEILVELEDHIEKEEVMHEKTFHTKEVSKLIEKHFSGGNLRKIEKRKTNKILLSDLEDTGSNILKKNSLITLNESDPISTNDSVQDYILKPVNQLEKTKDSQEKPSFETSRVYYEKDTLLISSKSN